MPIGSTISAVSGLSTAAGALIGNAFSNKIANKQIQANKDMAEQQRQYALEDREHAERYTSPVLEKMRLMDAGLSPANFVGNTAQSPDVAPTDLSGVNQPMSMLADNARQAGTVVGNSVASSVAVLKALSEVNKNNADSSEASANANKIEQTTGGIVSQIQLQNDNLAQDISLKMAQEENLVSSTHLNESERKEHMLNYSFLKDTYDLRKYTMQLESVLTELDVDKSSWDVNVKLPLDAELAKASIKEKKAHTAELLSMCDNLAAQTDNFKSLTNLNIEDLKQHIINTHILKSTEVDKIISEHELRRSQELKNKGEEYTNDKLEFETKTMLLDFIFKGISTGASAFRDIGVGANQGVSAIGNIGSMLMHLPKGANTPPVDFSLPSELFY